MVSQYLSKDLRLFLVFAFCAAIVLVLAPLVLELLMRGGFSSRSGWVCRHHQPALFWLFTSAGCLSVTAALFYILYLLLTS